MSINVEPSTGESARTAPKRGRPALNGSEKRKNRREDIIQASSFLFFRDGYSGNTLRRVAKAANVNVALIHYYFGSKQGLYQEVLSNAFAETLTSLRGQQKAVFPLPHLVRLMTAPLLEQPAFARTFLLPDGPPEAISTVADIRRRLRLHLSAALQTMQRTGRLRHNLDADLLTSTFLDLCWGPIRQQFDDESWGVTADHAADIDLQIAQNTKILEIAIGIA